MFDVAIVCCDLACSFGFYGSNCSVPCSCMVSVGCHHISGKCQCPSGYTGDSCDTGICNILIN